MCVQRMLRKTEIYEEEEEGGGGGVLVCVCVTFFIPHKLKQSKSKEGIWKVCDSKFGCSVV